VGTEAVDDALANLLAYEEVGGDAFFLDESLDLVGCMYQRVDRGAETRRSSLTRSNVFLALSLTWPRAIMGIFSLALC
jgi:hypothetical protein